VALIQQLTFGGIGPNFARNQVRTWWSTLVLAAVATAVVAGSATLSADIANAMTTLNTKIQNAWPRD
jgi:hypothetical protein